MINIFYKIKTLPNKSDGSKFKATHDISNRMYSKIDSWYKNYWCHWYEKSYCIGFYHPSGMIPQNIVVIIISPIRKPSIELTSIKCRSSWGTSTAKLFLRVRWSRMGAVISAPSCTKVLLPGLSQNPIAIIYI